ncbi:MAG: retron system putative HNH endonuclease [Cetobacterium sp.]
MFKVNKTLEPEFFTNFKKHHKMNNWNDYKEHPNIKQQLREYSLFEEQELCCPYCEIEIDVENSETEHIKPKDLFPDEFQNFDNLISACKTSKRCGNSKSNLWNIKFINPVLEDPQDYLTYDIKTGEIKPLANTGVDFEKAKITIEILNLNDKRLVNARKNFILGYKFAIDYLKVEGEYKTLKEFMIQNKESITNI